MLQRVLAFITIVSLCLLGLMLLTTTPATAGPFGLLVIFLTAYLAAVGLVSFFLYGLSRVWVYVLASATTRRPPKVLPFRRAYYFATVIAAAPVMLVGLQSVGTIGWYEVVLVVMFVVIGCIYVSRRIS